MNEPLRHRGYTFFQSSFIEAPEGEATVLAAVKNYCDHFITLQYAMGEQRGDKEIVLIAVKQNSYAINYASEELKNDPEFMKEVEQYL